MNRWRAEDGSTLTEVLAAATLGVVVLFGVLGLLDISARLAARSGDRVETTSRLRLAMDLIGRQVRSQICLGPGRPALTAADGNSLTFYASLAPEQPAGATTSPKVLVQRRQLTYRPATKDILQTVWTSDDEPGAAVVDFGPPAERILVSNVAPRDAATSVFGYYRFVIPAGGVVARPALITTLPLGTSDLARTVQVAINLVGLGTRPETRVAMVNTVFVRSASANNPENSPLCT